MCCTDPWWWGRSGHKPGFIHLCQVQLGRGCFCHHGRGVPIHGVSPSKRDSSSLVCNLRSCTNDFFPQMNVLKNLSNRTLVNPMDWQTWTTSAFSLACFCAIVYILLVLYKENRGENETNLFMSLVLTTSSILWITVPEKWFNMRFQSR